MMINIFNTATRKKEPLEPENGPVKIYTCGPTVYDRSTLGNLRTMLIYDFMCRTLTFLGYQVERTMNYTDVGHLTSDADTGEDKLAKKAATERKTAWQIAEANIHLYEEDAAALHLEPATHLVRATDQIPAMIELVKKLEEGGYTYQIDDGLYFDTAKFKQYGTLAKLDISGLKEGARVEKNPQKRQATDFALWKLSPKGEKRDMEWESPWGTGFPGWHLECSAIALATLGPTVDLHLGGIDLLTVHHQNELAQSEAANKQPFVKIWAHIEHLLIDGRRMGKSEGNAFTLGDLEAKGFSPLDFRYFIGTAHYRQKQNFTWEALTGAKTARHRLISRVSSWPTDGETDQTWLEKVKTVLADDLDLPQTIAAVWEYLESQQPEATKRATIAALDEAVLSCLTLDEEVDLPKNVKELVIDRERARSNKEYERADELRLEIGRQGYIIEDTAKGTKTKPVHGQKEEIARPEEDTPPDSTS